MTGANGKLLVRAVVAVALLVLLAAWALPGQEALGQTIPPWPTDSPTPEPTAPLPTSTPRPRPTWTQAPPSPTSAPDASTPTSTPEPALGAATPPAKSAPSASPHPTTGPAALVFDVLVEPVLAGPGDEVRFTVEVANVGRGPAERARVEALVPFTLEVRAIECGGCTSSQAPGALRLELGRLASGAQVIIPVLATVREDAWPGQVVETIWTASAEGVPTQRARASVELPWAELPATGYVAGEPGSGVDGRP